MDASQIGHKAVLDFVSRGIHKIPQVLVYDDGHRGPRTLTRDKQIGRLLIDSGSDAAGFGNARCLLAVQLHQPESVGLIPERFAAVIPETDAARAAGQRSQHPAADVARIGYAAGSDAAACPSPLQLRCPELALNARRTDVVPLECVVEHLLPDSL